MHNNIQPKGDALGFLDSYPSDKETIILPSGSSVEVKKYILKFKAWQGDKPVFDFGRKPIIDFDGEGCFAELAILRMFLKNGPRRPLGFTRTYWNSKRRRTGKKEQLQPNRCPKGWRKD